MRRDGGKSDRAIYIIIHHASLRVQPKKIQINLHEMPRSRRIRRDGAGSSGNEALCLRALVLAVEHEDRSLGRKHWTMPGARVVM